MFKGIYAIKAVNGKIEKVTFGLKDRIEGRNDIDMIIKNFDSINVCIMEKEIILQLTNTSIRAIGVRRSRGVSFEHVKGVLARLSLFDGVDATLYSGTRNIDIMNDAMKIKTWMR